jgi:predicted nucleic acid-binding Zn ribbon protein
MNMPTPISGLLKELLSNWGIERKVEYGMIMDKWPEIAGELVSKKTHIEKINNGKVFLKVENSTWRQEMVYHKKEFIDKMNQFIGKEVIKDILFI